MSLNQDIEDRIALLKKIITREKKALQYAPEGRLRGVTHGKGFQYYCRSGKQNDSGIYIRSGDKEFVRKLGQKEYNRRVLTAAEAELKNLEKAAAFYGRNVITVEQVYDNLPRWNQAVVQPLVEPWDQFAARWRQTPFEKKQIPDEQKHINEKNERMWSKSEELIGQMLDKYNLPYIYEKPLYLKGYGTIYPDFSILHPTRRIEIYWEHLGLIDLDSYRKTAFAKIADYERNGFLLGDRLIITYETAHQQLDGRLVSEKIRQFFL